jgi:hypothetical protein
MCIAALQPLPPTGHVYPFVYRQHCSHCHPLATCIHMCIGSTAATVSQWPRVYICLSPALQPLSLTGHVYTYVYRQHCSHCQPQATCIHMCIGSTAAPVTHWPRVSVCVSQHYSHCDPLATCIHICIAALQSLSPTGHVYPYVYRQHCSHCHPLATSVHMCIARTAATVTPLATCLL